MDFVTLWEWILTITAVLILAVAFLGFVLAFIYGIRESHSKKAVQQFDKDQPTRWLKPGSQSHTEKETE